MSFAYRTVWSVSLLVVVGFSLSILSGCGGGADYDGPERAAVSGSVTLDGSPVANGTIAFTAVGDGKSASGPIADGSYSIPEEQGPNLGKYKAEVISVPKSAGDDEEEEEEVEVDDEEEDETTEIRRATATSAELEIVSGDNTHDLTLASDDSEE